MRFGAGVTRTQMPDITVKNPYEFKSYLQRIIVIPADYDWSFESLEEFVFCLSHGAEIGFTWKGRHYHIMGCWDPLLFYEDYPAQLEQRFDTIEAFLDAELDGTPFREVVMQAEITERTL